ncbi:MAG: hypothetical protein V1802_01435 [Candidatus Aenigmatarchaeota archaeon]
MMIQKEVERKYLHPQKPGTKASHGNCNFEYAIEHAITGDEIEKAVHEIKKLHLSTKKDDYEGSANKLLRDIMTGYLSVAGKEMKRIEREMKHCPEICNYCDSRFDCYANGAKIEPLR